MERENVDVKYQWDLSKIYDSLDAFRKDINLVKIKIKEFAKFKDIKYDENKELRPASCDKGG